MSQTTYNVFPAEAFAGQVADGDDSTIKSYVADGEVLPGRLLELTTAGKVRMPQGTGSGLPIAGAAVLRTSSAGNAPISTNSPYPDGKVVPVMRKGRIWLDFNGGSPATGDSLNVKHSSTTDTHRGKVTGTTTSSSSGVEIANAYVQLHKLSAAGDLACVDVNYPALAGSIGPTGATGPTGPTGATGPTS